MMRKPFLTLSLLFLLCATLMAQGNDPTRFESAIEGFEKKDRSEPVDPGAILFVGSSSIVMWKSLGEDLSEYRTLNRGFGGSNFNDLIHYADRVIYPYQPKAVFIYEGDNDIGTGDTPKQVLKNAKKLRKMISKELGKDVPVVFISPKPSVARWGLHEKYEEANALLQKYANGKKQTYFADVWTPALNEEGEVMKHIFIEDNLHMNDAGYDIWEEVMEAMLLRIMP